MCNCILNLVIIQMGCNAPSEEECNWGAEALERGVVVKYRGIFIRTRFRDQPAIRLQWLEFKSRRDDQGDLIVTTTRRRRVRVLGELVADQPNRV
jgi:hypothetical protein